MCRRNWWTRTQGARAALRLAAVLASAATLGGCGLQRSSRPDDALPLVVHHGLREVMVVTHGEGSIFVTGLVDGWDGHAPAALHAALRDGVAAEIRALGLARVVTAEDTSAFVDASVPPPVPDSLDSQGVGGPLVPPPPTPRRGAAWVEVSLARADLDWVAGSDAPAILSARFVAKITAADPRAAAAGPLPRLVAERTFTLRDREPRLPAAWAADGGAAVTAALER
ncbi:MAG: hypothetical protein NDI82_12700, partial [Anaeromyxobacteraceae bacterium]|nr:hypothetical protein [Anaeromyxobacteraceae bacterium]